MDYNYGNSYGESSQDMYTDTYSLWNSSQYYNTNELSPRNFYTAAQYEETGSQTSFSPDPQPKREIVRDMYNRRIITKVSLFKEPELFYEPENEPESPIYGPPKSDPEARTSQSMSTRDEWTDQYWRRAGGVASMYEEQQRGIGNVRKMGKNKDARFKQKLMDAMAQPIKSSKAASIMQKMGWEGGALGKGGNGIVEPIAPNIAYVKTTLGFGTYTEAPSPKKKAKKCNKCVNQKSKKEKKEDFITNALLYILEFVRNDWETELVFDTKFTSKERRMLHQCVNEIINECDDELYAEGNMVKITNQEQERVLNDIRKYNNYVLYTESHGVMPHRQLCLYKDAPDHVYLITPDDLKETAVDPLEDEHEDNAFLKSIRRNIDETPPEQSNFAKLTNYFKSFIEEQCYTEFRFLGPFNNDESECLNAFLNDIAAGINNEGSCQQADVFTNEDVYFELSENCNGSMVIHKRIKGAST